MSEFRTGGTPGPSARTRLYAPMFVVLIAAVCHPAYSQPTQVVPLPDDVNTCVLCHCTAELWTGDKQRYFIAPDFLQGDVHNQQGVKCFQCHGGNPASLDPETAHPRFPQTEMTRACGGCHQDRYAELTQSVHGGAYFGEDGTGKPLTCRTCHSDPAHQIRPVRDLASPVKSRNQIAVCSECHKKESAEYEIERAWTRCVSSGIDSIRRLRRLPRFPRHFAGIR